MSLQSISVLMKYLSTAQVYLGLNLDVNHNPDLCEQEVKPVNNSGVALKLTNLD